MARIAAPTASGAVFAALIACRAAVLEFPIGSPKNVAGMDVAALYLQPIEMERDGHTRKAADSDVHMEGDIHALASTRLSDNEPELVTGTRLARPNRSTAASSRRCWRRSNGYRSTRASPVSCSRSMQPEVLRASANRGRTIAATSP